MNSQNTRLWASENPYNMHETSLHGVKIGVRFGLSWHRIIESNHLQNNSEHWSLHWILNEFVNQLDDEELCSGYFQHDRATCRTFHISMKEIESLFENQAISKGFWPPITWPYPLEFLLRGRHKSWTLFQLKDNIR